MKNSEAQVKTVLGDTIVALCRSMLSQHAHVHIDGLLGITLNSEEIFLVNISRSISNPSEGVKLKIEASERLESNCNDADHVDEENTEQPSPKIRRRRRKRNKSLPDDGDDYSVDETDDCSEDYKPSVDEDERSVVSDNHDNSASEDSSDFDHKDSLSNLTDTQAMFGSYCMNNEESSNQADDTEDHNDRDNDHEEAITVKTEVLSEEDSESNSRSALNSDPDAPTTPQLPWPFGVPQGFVPASLKLPTMHLPNITNMILGENGDGRRPVNPAWFGNSDKDHGSFHSNNNNAMATTATSPNKNGRGTRRWTKRQRAPETIVDLMLAEQNMMNSKTCPLCGRTFGEAWIMRRHMMVHTGAKAYQCQVCQKKFTRKDVLSAHMKVHWPKKPHQTCDGPLSGSSIMSLEQSDSMSISQSFTFPWNESSINSTNPALSATSSDGAGASEIVTTFKTSPFDSTTSTASVTSMNALSTALPESSVNITAISDAAIKYSTSNHLLSVNHSLLQGTQLSNVQL